MTKWCCLDAIECTIIFLQNPPTEITTNVSSNAPKVPTQPIGWGEVYGPSKGDSFSPSNTNGVAIKITGINEMEL